MLEILSKHTHFCFLDGYFDFSQIPVSAGDQSKLLLLALSVILLIDVCLLVYAMHLLPFKDAWWLYSLTFVKRFVRFSWMISLFMDPLLMIAWATLIEFCRDVKKLTLSRIGRSATLWLMKVLSWGIKFLKEVLKLTKLKLMLLKRCRVPRISKYKKFPRSRRFL